MAPSFFLHTDWTRRAAKRTTAHRRNRRNVNPPETVYRFFPTRASARSAADGARSREWSASAEGAGR